MLKYLLAFLLLVPSVAYGHYLQTDSNVGVLIHIDPADEPRVGQESRIYLEVKDKDKKFKPENYECRLEIFDQGKLLKSVLLFTDSDNDFSQEAVSFVFPHEGPYELKVTGFDKEHPDYHFQTVFNFRAEEAWELGLPHWQFLSEHNAHIILFGGGFLALFVYYIVDSKKLKKKDD